MQLLIVIIGILGLILAFPAGAAGYMDLHARHKRAKYQSHGAHSGTATVSIPGETLSGWKRLLSGAIDFYGPYLVAVLVAWLATGDDTFASPEAEEALAGAFFISFAVLVVVLGMTGRSPGKKLFGAKLVRYSSGGSVGFLRSTLRMILAFIVPFSYLVAFGKSRRTLHDRLTDTCVVRFSTSANEQPTDAYAPIHVSSAGPPPPVAQRDGRP